MCRTESPVCSEGISPAPAVAAARLPRRRVARPGGRPQPLPLRPRRAARRGSATAGCSRAGRRATRADRVRQREPLHRARHADVGEAALLLDLVAPRSSASAGRCPSSIPIRKTAPELEALRVVDRHQRHERRARRESRPGRRRARPPAGTPTATAPRLGPVLARDADELLQVLDPAARLDRPLGLVAPRSCRSASSTASTSSSTSSSCADDMQRLHRRDGSRARPSPRPCRGRPRQGRPSLPRARSRAQSAWVTSRWSDVSPIPRRGRLAMRSSDTASEGLRARTGRRRRP